MSSKQGLFNNPVPPGVIGELYIGGAGVARGYLNKPQLTAERFIPNPFATDKDKTKGYTRLYKTGDLVRWLPDGNLEYIGRNDDQVKIRGYRIELGEIEHALLQITGIQQSCVLAKERKTETGTIKYLVGYYVLENSANPITQTIILEKLSQLLPDYMVPSALVAMNSFPLTVNGKLDRRALPNPEFITTEEYVAPTNETEALVCKIWQDILGVEQVGITDNFFKIGGNSILAIQTSHRISKALNCEVKVADIFKHKAIAQLLTHTIHQTQISISKLNTNQAILSFAQERLWFIEQYEQGTNAYHIPELYELNEATNIEGIKYALQQIISRHEVLRSTIEQKDNQKQGIQKVHDTPLAIEEITLSNHDYHITIKEDINRHFNLSQEYPIRVKFYHIQPNDSSENEAKKTLLLINIHHIASDGWSTEIFQKELLAYYEAYINNNKTFSLPTLEIQYKDYAVWQRAYLIGELLEKQLHYWKEKLTGYQTLELPTDYKRPSQVNYKGATQEFKLSKETSRQLRALAQRYGTTLHTVILSSVHILLSKYAAQNDIVTGTPIASRHHRQTEQLIGFFVNTQVNRTLLKPNQSFEELIQQVHQDQIGAQLHQDLPFEKLVDELGIERDISRHPVFQVMLAVQASVDDNLKQNYLKPYSLNDIYEVAKFDLSIFIDDSGEELIGSVNYATALFHKDTITRLISHYTYLLEHLIATVEKPYTQISLLSAEEYHKIVYEWNQTDKDYPKHKTIHQLFQEQAERTPDNIALVFENQQLTYKQLNEKSNQLAWYIRKQYKQKTKQELQPDTLIALCLNRSLEMVIGILAVLKAGGAYVPIDPNYPEERINYILEDTKAEWILSQRQLTENNNIVLPKDKVIYIDLSENLYNKQIKSNLPQHSKALDLAYVIYTSGTTGKPKGVMIEHLSTTNRILHMIAYAHIISSDFYLFKTNYTFDVSVSDLFTHFCTGAKIQITKSVFDLEELQSLLYSDKFTSLHLVPSQFDIISSIIDTRNIQSIYFSGEALTADIISSISKNTKVYNYYGPTETGEITVYSPLSPIHSSIIGKVFPNSRQYIVDKNNNPVPPGVIGELYIGGAGVARGYLNKPQLTAERFIPNPFATDKDKTKGYTRLYKTGDLVRWLPDGNLEYIGRNDDQVKIRGYRIELGEIEHALLQITGIQQSCVLAKERKTETGTIKYLVGYYVLENSANPITQTIILEKLSQLLPDYMVPSALVAMNSFPLTVNGKLDRRALPNPEFITTEEYVAPTNETEALVCKIWQDILGVEQVGITDNFFKIGGNSILVMQLTHRMGKALNCEINVFDIFKYKTISQISTQAIHQRQIDTLSKNLKTPSNNKEMSTKISKRSFNNSPHSYIKLESKPLLSLFAVGELAPVDASAFGYFTASEKALYELCHNVPTLTRIYETYWGRIALIDLPIFNTEIYDNKRDLMNLIIQGLKLSKNLGAKTVSLTGIIPSATNYGKAIQEEIIRLGEKNLPDISTGHATTSASVVLAIKNILDVSARQMQKECVAYLGLGSIGLSSIRLMLHTLPHPKEILLCDIYGKEESLINIKNEITQATNYKGVVRILLANENIPKEIYESSLIIGCTNVPEVLDIELVKPGTIIVDDSGPHCFSVKKAIKRIKEDNDILFTEGGLLKLPHPVQNTFYFPSSIQELMSETEFKNFMGQGSFNIMGCTFSSILLKHFKNIKPTIGTTKLEDSLQNYQTLLNMGITAADLNCEEYILTKACIEKFRNTFGHMAEDNISLS